MTDNITIEIGFLITIILFVISVINFFVSRKSSVKKDVEKDVENNVKVNMKLDEICRTTNETRSDIKSMQNAIKDIQEEQIKQKVEIEALRKDVDLLKAK